MTENMKFTLECTEKLLCRHLEDLCNEVEENGGHVKDHMIIDGVKDCLKSLKCLKVLGAIGMGGEDGKQTAAVATPTK